MIPPFAPTINRLSLLCGLRRPPRSPLPAAEAPVIVPDPPRLVLPTPLVRPSLARLAQPDADLPAFVATCPVARKYLDLLGALDWDHFPERDPRRPWPGPAPQPRAPFAAAFLVKLEEQKRYMSDLRTFLVEHPALVWVLGFPLVAAPDLPHGFDVEASLPSTRQFGRVLRELPNRALQFLLDAAISAIARELPPEVHFGETVCGDTKHIIAWVKENNPKAYIKKGERYDKTRQPSGDPDCRLGVKKRANQTAHASDAAADAAPDAPPAGAAAPASVAPAAPATPTGDPIPARRRGGAAECYWGYASGIIATKVPDWGEFVLAEHTQTFDRADVTYFFPLMADVERRLGHRPQYGAFDAAFDAFYVHEWFHTAGGFAAVPFVERGGCAARQFDADGLPLCAAGLPMPLKSTFICKSSEVEHERGRYVCPLRFPEPSAAGCPQAHKNWAKGGCTTTMATSIGARLRHQLDRHSPEYKAVYKQRTADERINSQALELGIERPKLRNQRAITNYNTLIYILISLRGLQRVRERKRALAHKEVAVTPS